MINMKQRVWGIRSGHSQEIVTQIVSYVNPLDRKLRALADTDEEADEYMNIVFELCTAKLLWSNGNVAGTDLSIIHGIQFCGNAGV